MIENSKLGATPNVFNRRASDSGNGALGPLGQLAIGDQWVGDSGFNLMVVPNPNQQFLVMISPLFETHVFTAVGAPVPNRSANNGTEQIGAVKYTQTVAENVSKNILHEETGMWLNQTPGTNPDGAGYGLQMVDPATTAAYITPNPIMRSGTIPHGNTIHATGTATTFDTPVSGNVLPYIAIDNFPNVSGELVFLPTFADGSDPTELQQDFKAQIAASLKLIGETEFTVEDFINPIRLLNKYADNLKSVTSLAVTTEAGKGGVLNIPYERAFAGPQNFICTFMIEEVNTAGFNPVVSKPAQDEMPTYFQIQYLQSIPLLFPKGYCGKDVLFPHWNVNTLVAV
jgi:hypothetical protein